MPLITKKKIIILVNFLTLSISNACFSSSKLPDYLGNYTIAGVLGNKFNNHIDLSAHLNSNACIINELIDKTADHHIKIPAANNTLAALTNYSRNMNPIEYVQKPSQDTKYIKCLFTRIEKLEPYWFWGYPGSINDAYESLKNTPVYESYFDCYQEGDRYPDNQSIEFYPLYQCPKGYTSKGHILGCLKNEELICPGDVLGRDLDLSSGWPDFIRAQGHVGVTVFQSDHTDYPRVKVAEMDGKSSNPLHIAELSDFKKIVENGFWGAKYGTLHHPSMSLEKYNNMQKLLDTIYSDEVVYTMGWKYNLKKEVKAYLAHPIGFYPVVTTMVIPSTFRCDTLVKYLYEKGAGIALDLNGYFTPKDLYGSLISERDNTTYSGYNLTTSNEVQCSGSQPKIEDEITAHIAPKSYKELYQLDNCMRVYIKLDSPNAQKINFLWNLYETESDLTSKQYVLESLTLLKPLPIADKIITEFKAGNVNGELYYVFIDLLFSCLWFTDEQKVIELSERDKVNILEIYKLFDINEDNFPKMKGIRPSMFKKHPLIKS